VVFFVKEVFRFSCWNITTYSAAETATVYKSSGWQGVVRSQQCFGDLSS